MQPTLVHIPTVSDCHATPFPLAKDIVDYFCPSDRCLDPCRGDGVFYDLLPSDSEWCEIEQGRDFYAWSDSVSWIIGNPPYSHYAAWLRHSFTVATNIVYLMPVYKIFTSGKFLDELFEWGGIVHVRRYGTGSAWGFPFGHALVAVHYRAGHTGDTSWSKYKEYNAKKQNHSQRN